MAEPKPRGPQGKCCRIPLEMLPKIERYLKSYEKKTRMKIKSFNQLIAHLVDVGLDRK